MNIVYVTEALHNNLYQMPLFAYESRDNRIMMIEQNALLRNRKTPETTLIYRK